MPQLLFRSRPGLARSRSNSGLHAMERAVTGGPVASWADPSRWTTREPSVGVLQAVFSSGARRRISRRAAKPTLGVRYGRAILKTATRRAYVATSLRGSSPGEAGTGAGGVGRHSGRTSPTQYQNNNKDIGSRGAAEDQVTGKCSRKQSRQGGEAGRTGWLSDRVMLKNVRPTCCLNRAAARHERNGRAEKTIALGEKSRRRRQKIRIGKHVTARLGGI